MELPRGNPLEAQQRGVGKVQQRSLGRLGSFARNRALLLVRSVSPHRPTQTGLGRLEKEPYYQEQKSPTIKSKRALLPYLGRLQKSHSMEGFGVEALGLRVWG